MNHPQPQIPYHEYSTPHFWSKANVKSNSSVNHLNFTYTLSRNTNLTDIDIWINILIYCSKNQTEYHGTFYYITALSEFKRDPSQIIDRQLLLNSIIDIVSNSITILEQYIYEVKLPLFSRGCTSNTNKEQIIKMCQYWFKKYEYDIL